MHSSSSASCRWAANAAGAANAAARPAAHTPRPASPAAASSQRAAAARPGSPWQPSLRPQPAPRQSSSLGCAPSNPRPLPRAPQVAGAHLAPLLVTYPHDEDLAFNAREGHAARRARREAGAARRRQASGHTRNGRVTPASAVCHSPPPPPPPTHLSAHYPRSSQGADLPDHASGLLLTGPPAAGADMFA